MTRNVREGDSLIVLIKTMHQALRAALEHAMRDVGHTLPQQAVLVAIAHEPGASSAELARGAFVSPQSMSELLGQLQKAGWIAREPNPDNARILRTTLTSAGRATMARGGKQLAAVEARLAAAMTSDEQTHLRTLLGRALDALR